MIGRQLFNFKDPSAHFGLKQQKGLFIKNEKYFQKIIQFGK